MANAIEMLRDDHRQVKELFHQFERTEEEDRKKHIAAETLHELEVHARLEEEIFYPAARQEIDDKQLIIEALEEHHVAKILLSELKRIGSGDERFDAKYKVLAENVKHHIQEEESKLFPMLEDSLATDEVGQEMEARKEQLQEKLSNRPQPRGRKSRGRSSKKRRGRASGGR
ncbi:MAG TPA: hemerythrin domain-containing protein [Candidatus Udaeobacter sp.]|nr:hemerythrin domain-containing protein [Candidatus Udaeobacter sp.]